jgi:RNA recognition motif-containing protein
MAKVYVGNLASSVTSQDLAALFARAGEVRAALAIIDRKSGLCRGFGFVEMAHTDDAVIAASLLNNAELNGRQIKIDGTPARKSATREKNGNKSRAERN